MISSEEVRRNITFILPPIGLSPSLLIILQIMTPENHTRCYNAGIYNETIDLPKYGEWVVVAEDQQAGTEPIRSFTGNKVEVRYRSATVLYLDER